MKNSIASILGILLAGSAFAPNVFAGQTITVVECLDAVSAAADAAVISKAAGENGSAAYESVSTAEIENIATYETYPVTREYRVMVYAKGFDSSGLATLTQFYVTVDTSLDLSDAGLAGKPESCQKIQAKAVQTKEIPSNPSPAA